MFKITCFYLSVFLLIFSSCKISKQLPYFKDLSDSVAITKLATKSYQPLILQTDDEVQIIISNSSPEASQYFNMATPSPLNSTPGATLPGNTVNGVGGSSTAAAANQNVMNIYRVSYSGNITLPILKEVKAAGLTTEELKAKILDLLQPYLKDPVVIIKLTNFKVTVIGEVGRPVIVPVNGQTINVLEAIGAAGDMTAFGVRNNVRVIRKLPDGSTEVAVLNFNKSNTFQSPFFQLRQNDIVYITPNKNKSLASSQTAIWVSIFSTIATITVILITNSK
jgi:polysaccharide export outer membrane protein